MPALFAALHHLAFFAMIGALFAQFALLRSRIDQAAIKRLAGLDAMYAGSATLVLIIGTVRVIYFEKGWAYYSLSLPFWLKIASFIVVAIISFYATGRFNAWRKQGADFIAPANEVSRILRLKPFEMSGLALVLIFAALMARGFWMLG